MNRDFAETYGSFEQWHWWFRGRQRILETVLKQEFVKGSARAVVSVGCGPMEGLTWVSALVPPTGYVVGLDSDPLHARCSQQGVNYVVGSAEAVPFASRSFDVVLALDILEHLEDDVAGLREFSRVLKPGGFLMVTVPALPSLWGGTISLIIIDGDTQKEHSSRCSWMSHCRAPMSHTLIHCCFPSLRGCGGGVVSSA